MPIRNTCVTCGRKIITRTPAEIYLKQILMNTNDAVCSICNPRSTWKLYDVNSHNIKDIYSIVIDDILDKFTIDEKNRTEIKEYYAFFYATNDFLGESITHIIIAFIFIMLKNMKISDGYFSNKYVEKINSLNMGISKKQLHHNVRKLLKRGVEKKYPNDAISIFLIVQDYIMNELGLRIDIIDSTKKDILFNKRNIMGKNPMAIIATSIYWNSNKFGYPYTQSQIASFIGVFPVFTTHNGFYFEHIHF